MVHTLVMFVELEMLLLLVRTHHPLVAVEVGGCAVHHRMKVALELAALVLQAILYILLPVRMP